MILNFPNNNTYLKELFLTIKAHLEKTRLISSAAVSRTIQISETSYSSEENEYLGLKFKKYFCAASILSNSTAPSGGD